MTRIRASVLWLTAIFVVLTSAFGYAQVGEKTKAPKDHGTPAADRKGDDEAGEVSDEATEKKAEKSKDSGERKLNHGFYVSQAAHCEDVDDPETDKSPDFTAPDDCAGAGHGKYVSSVAKSSVGKKPKKDAGGR